jgi:hypothetical protein
LEQLSYLVIGITVIVQGLSVGFVGKLLGVLEERNGYLIIGTHPLCRTIARWLKDRKLEVKLVDTNDEDVLRANRLGFEAYHGNALETFFLEKIGLQRIGRGLALTSNDKVNTLFSQLFKKKVGPHSAYQISPSVDSSETTDYLREAGGSLIFPGLLFLNQVTEKLSRGEAAWIEVTLNQGEKYEGRLSMHEGDFWPLFQIKGKSLSVVTAGEDLKKGDRVAGLLIR